MDGEAVIVYVDCGVRGYGWLGEGVGVEELALADGVLVEVD